MSLGRACTLPLDTDSTIIYWMAPALLQIFISLMATEWICIYSPFSQHRISAALKSSWHLGKNEERMKIDNLNIPGGDKARGVTRKQEDMPTQKNNRESKKLCRIVGNKNVVMGKWLGRQIHRQQNEIHAIKYQENRTPQGYDCQIKYKIFSQIWISDED